eukprot:1771050-Amphidinium_carterae.1
MPALISICFQILTLLDLMLTGHDVRLAGVDHGDDGDDRDDADDRDDGDDGDDGGDDDDDDLARC